MAAIKIAGGGPAGLACGIRLRQLGLEVEVYERQRYPLRKVCGEFLSQPGWEKLESLGARKHLRCRAATLDRARFYYSAREFFEFPLGPPARGLSREAMDTALKDRFVELGGILHEGKSAPEDAQVLATGRVVHGEGEWNGWKAYAEGMELEAPLVMVGMDQAYMGLAQVEEGRVSACMLWKGKRRPEEILAAHPLLEKLAPRLRFHASVAGFDFEKRLLPGRAGDALRAWPPVAGDGMNRAMQEGIQLAEALAGGRKAVVSGNDFEFFLSKAVHSLMLSPFFRRLIGPCLKPWPSLAGFLYRKSRVH